jgi:CRP-like cAMP-binding protein
MDMSDEVQSITEEYFEVAEFPKGYQLLLPGNRSKKLFFFEEGLARSYYFKDGKDITLHFFSENSFNMPVESIFHNRPSPYGLELLENCKVWYTSYIEFEKYFNQSPEMGKMARELLINVLSAFSDHLFQIQFQTARQRYQILLENHPDILLRTPLGHIASYLGITQQTLSVIRAQK